MKKYFLYERPCIKNKNIIVNYRLIFSSERDLILEVLHEIQDGIATFDSFKPFALIEAREIDKYEYIFKVKKIVPSNTWLKKISNLLILS